MQQSLNVIADFARNGSNALNFDWHNLRYQHTAAIRAYLATNYKPATANKMLSALRRVLFEAWQLGLMDAEDYRRAATLKNIRGESLPKGRALSLQEVSSLLSVCFDDSSISGIRDAAILAVLFGNGLRRSELVNLDLSDYDRSQNSIRVRSGKGGKDRLTYLAKGCDIPLNNWLDVRGNQSGGLFLPTTNGKLTNRRLAAQSVFDILARRAKEAGVSSFSPHDLRRTFISNLLDAGADIATVQRMAGHASVSTTARYDRRGEETKKKAAELVSLPITERIKND